MPRSRPFGVSTYLYHGQRLGREHLSEIAAHGFDTVELFATRTHFDYHSPGAIAGLQEWLGGAGLSLSSVHAPVCESYIGGRTGGPLSLASGEASAREHALAEAEQALLIARRIPFRTLVVHLGVPRSQQTAAGENSRDAARRSVEALQRVADPLDVRVAVEVIPNELSRAGSLVHFVERTIDAPGVGVCLDFGHAHMDGDVVDAVETVAEHLVGTHVHDNMGTRDDHLVPFEGSIDWAGALTAVQKVGYEGALMMELVTQGPAKDTLRKAQQARKRMEQLLVYA